MDCIAVIGLFGDRQPKKDFHYESICQLCWLYKKEIKKNRNSFFCSHPEGACSWTRHRSCAQLCSPVGSLFLVELLSVNFGKPVLTQIRCFSPLGLGWSCSIMALVIIEGLQGIPAQHSVLLKVYPKCLISTMASSLQFCVCKKQQILTYYFLLIFLFMKKCLFYSVIFSRNILNEAFCNLFLYSWNHLEEFCILVLPFLFFLSVIITMLLASGSNQL